VKAFQTAASIELPASPKVCLTGYYALREFCSTSLHPNHRTGFDVDFAQDPPARAMKREG